MAHTTITLLRGTFPSRVLARVAAFGCLALALALAPIFASDVWLMFLTGVFIWVAMVWAWDLLATAGYISLATAAWFGLGAYTTAVLMNHFGQSFAVAVLGAALGVGALSMVVAVPLYRLRSHYFIMGTLIIAEVAWLLMDQVRFFGIQGASLMHLPQVAAGDPDYFNRLFYFMALGLLGLAFVVVFAIRHSRMGLALRAIGQDEATAETLGVPMVLFKLLAFGLSSGFFALAGGLTAYWTGFVQQAAVFNLLITVKVIVISILGGIGTIAGPIVGAITVQFLEQILGPSLAELNKIIYGVIVVSVVVLLPSGLVPGVARWTGGRSMMGVLSGVVRSAPKRQGQHCDK